MPDLSDYMNNDILHLQKGILSHKWSRRASIMSAKQLRIKVVSEVTNIVYNNPNDYKTFSSVIELAGNLVLELSTSLDGRGIDKVIEGSQSRLAVNDETKAVVGKEKGEFNE